MRRYIGVVLIILLTSAVLATGCILDREDDNTPYPSPSQTNGESKNISVMLNIDFHGLKEPVQTIVITEKGTTVLEMIMSLYDVEYTEVSGVKIVTAIDGIGQDIEKNLFWRFFICGKSPQGTADIVVLEDGDSVQFQLFDAGKS
ncbi:MAG: DUF4430 domain-containing protein [Candidatus Methanofastidiosia archaeon]